MALKHSYATEQDVPDGLKEHYQAAQDGSFVLQLDEESMGAGFRVENVSGLSSALQSERDAVKGLKSSLARYDAIKDLDLSGDQIKSMIDENARLKESETDQVKTLNARLEEQKANRQTAINQATQPVERQRDLLLGKLKTEMVEARLENAVRAKGAEPEALTDRLAKQIGTKIDWDNEDDPIQVFVKDVNGNPRLTAEAKPFSIEDLVAEDVENPKFARLYGLSTPTNGPGGRPIQPVTPQGSMSEQAAMNLSDEEFQKAVKEGRI